MKRWTHGLLVVSSAAVLAASACAKKQEEKAGTTQPATSATTAPSSSAAPVVARGYSRGDALSYLPQECAGGRLYIDVAALAGVAGDAAHGIEAQLANLGGEDAKKAEKVIQVLKAGGFDPATSIKEVGLCILSAETAPVLAMGGDFSKIKGDPLDLMVKAIEAAGEDKPEKKHEGKLAYLTLDDGMATVVGNAIVLGKDVKALQRAAEGKGAGGFKNAMKSQISVDMDLPPRGKLMATLVDAGEDLQLAASLQATGRAAEELKANPDASLKQLKDMVQSAASELGKTPFKDLAPPLSAMKFAADGDTIKADTALPKKSIRAAILAARSMKPEELRALAK